MKKLISILLVAVMLVAMVPAAIFTSSAETTTSKWTDAGNYDLSWAEPLVTTTATPGQSATVDGKIYTIKYHIGTYVIDTPEKLAGIAILANSVIPENSNSTAESFSGTVFKITKDLDLGDHLWEPIANNDKKKFRGTITSDNGAVISNMTIKSTDNNAANAYGLVGVQGSGQQNTGTITNITLENATIDVVNGYVGSFVGFINYGGVEYSNLKSDATIKCSTTFDAESGIYASNSNAWNAVGGIIGRVNDWGGLDQKITGCVFTGSIDAPTATAVGGIIAIDRRNKSDDNKLTKLTITKCVVASEFFRWGAERPGGANGGDSWYSGLGGIVGVRLYGDLVIEECYASIGDIIILGEQDTPNELHIGVGGMLGNWAENANGMTFKNCQVDTMSSSGAFSAHHGAFVGRQLSKVTFENCVNTGAMARVAAVGASNPNTYVWSAFSTDLDMSEKTNFSIIPERYGVDYTFEFPTIITAKADWFKVLNRNVWASRDGSMYPVLKIAAEYTKYSSVNDDVDFSFFTPVDDMRIKTESQFKAIARIADMLGDEASDFVAPPTSVTGNVVTIIPTLSTVDTSAYSENTQALLRSEFGAELDKAYDAEGAVINMDKSFIQTSKDGKYVRVAILVKASDCSAVSIDVALSRTNDANVQKFGTFTTSGRTTKAFRNVSGISASEQGGGEDWVYVVFTINGVDLGYNTTFTIRANAYSSDGNTVTQSTACNYSVAAMAN